MDMDNIAPINKYANVSLLPLQAWIVVNMRIGNSQDDECLTLFAITTWWLLT